MLRVLWPKYAIRLKISRRERITSELEPATWGPKPLLWHVQINDEPVLGVLRIASHLRISVFWTVFNA